MVEADILHWASCWRSVALRVVGQRLVFYDDLLAPKGESKLITLFWSQYTVQLFIIFLISTLIVCREPMGQKEKINK